MAFQVSLGGDRIGSGAKMEQELHDYGFTSFNQEQDFKSSMAPGILYPFIKIVGTNHDSLDIDMDTFVRTLPTQGPLLGSFKLQVDLFNVPFRLYQGVLHNNPQDIGMDMHDVFLPKMLMRAVCSPGGPDAPAQPRVKGSSQYSEQVSESALMKYLGLSGIGKGFKLNQMAYPERKIQAVPMLAYYDIFKNYYANKQEEDAYVIVPGNIEPAASMNGYEVGQTSYEEEDDFTILGTMGILFSGTNLTRENVYCTIEIGHENIEGTMKEINDFVFAQTGNQAFAGNPGGEAIYNGNNVIAYFTQIATAYGTSLGEEDICNFKVTAEEASLTTADIKLQSFKLKNIDKMRSALLKVNEIGEEFLIAYNNEAANWSETSGVDNTGLPYITNVQNTEKGIPYTAFAQNGLVVKTYQSDLFNNWLNTEMIDGENGISKISSIAVVDGAFTMDSLVMGEKVWDYLNRVLVAGGTYQDWQEASYGKGAIRICETPMYVGGMSAEIMFEEVVSSSETNVNGDFQPLGALGGKGTQIGQKGGKNIHVKFDEPGYLMGIVSITPRICYSQGNDWDLTELDSMEDLHKPAFDGIGFQDLIVEQMAWWDTVMSLSDGEWHVTKRSSAGKQTAWINYQTAIDKAYGDFAKQDGYSFMVLGRNYEMDGRTSVGDLTTYIDPVKFNYAFAVNDLAAQNFWVQIHSKVIARRKMSAQQIPNL